MAGHGRRPERDPPGAGQRGASRSSRTTPSPAGRFPDFYHSTFHAPWYIFEHWSRWFTVAAFLPRRSMDYQDFVLLHRPEGDGPAGGEDVAGDRAAAPTVSTNGKIAPIERGATIVRGAAGVPASRAGVVDGRRHARVRPLPGRAAAARRHRPRRRPAPRPVRAGGPFRLAEKLLGAHRGQRMVNVHQREVDRALFTALWELDGTVSATTRSGGVPPHRAQRSPVGRHPPPGRADQPARERPVGRAPPGAAPAGRAAAPPAAPPPPAARPRRSIRPRRPIRPCRPDPPLPADPPMPADPG